MKLARERSSLIYWRYRVNVRNQLKTFQWDENTNFKTVCWCDIIFRKKEQKEQTYTYIRKFTSFEGISQISNNNKHQKIWKQSILVLYFTLLLYHWKQTLACRLSDPLCVNNWWCCIRELTKKWTMAFNFGWQYRWIYKMY